MKETPSWRRQLRRWLPWAVLLLILVAIGYWVGPRPRPYPQEPELPTLAPLPQHPRIQVAFNQSRESTYRDPYRQIYRYGYNLEELIISQIRSARQSVDVAVQELNLPLVAQALAERRQAGIPVRVITENTYVRAWHRLTPAEVQALDERSRQKFEEYRHLVDVNRDGRFSPEEIASRDVYALLDRGQVPWLDDTADGSKGSGLMHHKFVIIDGQRVLTGSANFTLSDIHGDFAAPGSVGNANHLLLLDSPELARLYTEEFNLMWGDGPGGLPDSRFGVRKHKRPLETVFIGDAVVGVHFSPASRSLPYEATSNGIIAATLAQAQKQVDLALFVFTDLGIANQLRQLRQERNVEIRGVFDPGFAFRDYSRTLEMWGLLLPDENCRVDAARLPWTVPASSVGVPNLAPGDKLHHKFAIVDPGTPQATVITGSHNWSLSANHLNDENLLIIRNSQVANHFVREFERLLANAHFGPSRRLQQEVEEAARRCPNPLAVALASSPSESELLEGEVIAVPKGRSSPSPAALPPAPAPGSSLVNLNTATAAELEQLPGVGPDLAQRIIEARPFSSLEDLQRVKGIGPAKVEQLRGRVTW
ncbi:phospholipase D-like domain-containing protein [Synechococcus sp. H70.2]|uniref:phospholipase D-like domain-containing protein n=1 Tax=Synechococcus sp. H70.2 TaxID=2964528 RepID=UPI0039C013E8